MHSALPLTLVALLAGACGGPVEIASPTLSGSDLAACTAFVDALPATLAGEERREVEPPDALGAAYGDPAIVVTCGVDPPDGFDRLTSSCEVANGVGWYVPPEQFDDQSADVTLTTPGFRPVVQVDVPGSYRPDSPAAAIAELAAGVDEHLRLVENCD